MSKDLKGYEEAYSFYEGNYEVIDAWFLEPGKKIILGKRDCQVCRFCGQGGPLVTFKSEAHAIPECLGNKSLFTAYECDTCNQKFGQGIENDFGIWSKPMRSVTRTRGKRGVPTIKMQSVGGSQGKLGPMEIAIQQNRADPTPIFEFNEEAKTLKIVVHRDPYTPIAVLKTFVKIGLSVLPEVELPNFEGILSWIQDSSHRRYLVNGYPILRTLIPGPYTFPVSLLLLRRKEEQFLAPYITYVLGYGIEVFQVWLLSEGRDRHIMGKKIAFPHFPLTYTDELHEGALSTTTLLPEAIDLTNCSLVENETVPITIQFNSVSQEPSKATTTSSHSRYQTLNLRVKPSL